MNDGTLQRGLELICQRVERTLQARPEGFPHYADPDSGEWTCTDDGDWTGGFWLGMLWLSGLVADDKRRYREAARPWLKKLALRQDSETVFRGFLFWYGAALGHLLADDEEARAIALAGAHSLATLYNPRAGLIPLGRAAEEFESVGLAETNIDGIAGTTPLLAWASAELGDSSLKDVARRHVERHIELCVRSDGSVCQSASVDPETGRLLRRYTHKGYSGDSTWARAQAWGMLGLAQSVAWLDSSFADGACTVADWWLKHLPHGPVPFWDFDDPDIPNAPRDTSAAAIVCAALLKLSKLVPSRAQGYREAAVRTAVHLLREHLTPRYDGDQRPPGMLLDGCYNRRLGVATRHELIWGDYFLMEALAGLTGLVDTSTL